MWRGIPSQHRSRIGPYLLSAQDESGQSLDNIVQPKGVPSRCGNGGVGGLGHAGEVADENAVGKTKSEWDVVEFRVQFGC